MDKHAYEIILAPSFEKTLKRIKKKNPTIANGLEKQIIKLCDYPDTGKPLRNILKNKRRIHIGSFVLIYEIYKRQIFLLDFDHHDKIYKKHRSGRF